MIRNHVILLFLLFLFSKEEEFITFAKYKEYAYNVLKSATEHSEISDYCKNNILDSLDKEEYLNKIIYDSSKNANDLGNPKDCTKFKYGFNSETESKIKNMTLEYIIFTIYTSAGISNHHIFGVCVPNFCSEEEFKQIFLTANNENNYFPEVLPENVDTYNLHKNKADIWLLLRIIPILIFVILIICNIFPKLAYYIFYPLFACLRMSSKERKISECFNVSQNFEGLDLKANISATNEASLNILNGIRGIMLILLSLSISCKEIIDSPTRVYSEGIINKFITSFYYVVFSFGYIYGSRVFYAISGFSLIYKFFNYLDKVLENEADKANEDLEDNDEDYYATSINKENLIRKERKSRLLYSDIVKLDSSSENKEKNLKNSKKSKDESSDLFSAATGDNKLQEEEKKMQRKESAENELMKQYGLIGANPNDILGIDSNYVKFRYFLSFKNLLYFFNRQLYKYIMFIFTLIVFRYVLFDILLMTFEPTTPFIYYKTLLNKFSLTKFLCTIFLFSNFSKKINFPYAYFYFILNEIFIFIIFTPILFIGYKRNLRLDIIFILTFFILFAGKITFCALINQNNSDPDNRLNTFTFYLQDSFSDLVSNNILYNLTFAITGIIFGLMHYSLEKGLKLGSHRRYSKILTDIKIYFKQEKTFSGVVCVLSAILFLLMPCLNYFLVDSGKKPDSNSVNLSACIGADIAVLFLFLFLETLYMLGMSTFFKHPLWNYFSKPYFSFLLIISLFSPIIFYNNEASLPLENFYVFFFGLILLLICLMIQIITFLFLELPLKRLNALFIKELEKKKLL